jgi:hypothetical protein
MATATMTTTAHSSLKTREMARELAIVSIEANYKSSLGALNEGGEEGNIPGEAGRGRAHEQPAQTEQRLEHRRGVVLHRAQRVLGGRHAAVFLEPEPGSRLRDSFNPGSPDLRCGITPFFRLCAIFGLSVSEKGV